jgi:hypothetical protein
MWFKEANPSGSLGRGGFGNRVGQKNWQGTLGSWKTSRGLWRMPEDRPKENQVGQDVSHLHLCFPWDLSLVSDLGIRIHWALDRQLGDCRSGPSIYFFFFLTSSVFLTSFKFIVSQFPHLCIYAIDAWLSYFTRLCQGSSEKMNSF